MVVYPPPPPPCRFSFCLLLDGCFSRPVSQLPASSSVPFRDSRSSSRFVTWAPQPPTSNLQPQSSILRIKLLPGSIFDFAIFLSMSPSSLSPLFLSILIFCPVSQRAFHCCGLICSWVSRRLPPFRGSFVTSPHLTMGLLPTAGVRCSGCPLRHMPTLLVS